MPILTLRVYNYAHRPAPLLEATEREARNIFRQAGVELKYFECGLSPEEADKMAACDRVLEQHVPSVTVKLIPESMEAGLPRPTEMFAIAIQSTVFVFCERVRRAAETSGIPESWMLGVILAHELGHEVLGQSSHSASGVMKATLRAGDFELADKGRLRFSTEQERRLRARLKSSAWLDVERSNVHQAFGSTPNTPSAEARPSPKNQH